MKNWCEESVLMSSQFLSQIEMATGNGDPAPDSSYQGVGTLSFRAHPIYLGA